MKQEWGGTDGRLTRPAQTFQGNFPKELRSVQGYTGTFNEFISQIKAASNKQAAVSSRVHTIHLQTNQQHMVELQVIRIQR